MKNYKTKRGDGGDLSNTFKMFQTTEQTATNVYGIAKMQSEVGS